MREGLEAKVCSLETWLDCGAKIALRETGSGEYFG